MKKEQFIRRIIGVEIIGFLCVIIIVWLDELFDLPHNVFGALPSSINYSESLFESIVIVLLGLVIILLTHAILQRLRFFEGLVPVCSFCKKIRSGDQWMPIVEYIGEHSEADFSHTVCPECMEANYGDIIK